MPIVTVITPSYNSSAFIGVTIESVLTQSFTDLEMIIVDDCSTDNSVEFIESYAKKDSRVKLIKLAENSGAAIARNTAIKAANGRYIAFLDSDDLWSENKLEYQLKYMQENDIAFSYAAYNKIDDNGNFIGRVGVPEKVSYSDLLKVCSIGCLTAMYDSKKLGKVYMPIIRKRQDLGLWLRILTDIPFAYSCPGTLAEYRVRGGSISANKKNAALYTWKLYRDVEKLNLFKASYYFSRYAINGVLRTKVPRLARLMGVLK
jgi:glycosyltransferase involved in cell wall biosynthesis